VNPPEESIRLLTSRLRWNPDREVRVTGRIRLAVWIVALGLIASENSSILEQQPANGGWVGKRVVQKYRGFQLKVKDPVVDRKGRLETYRVEQVNGPWLWLHAPGLSGWAPADQVVPVEQAIGFVTDYIQSNPADTYAYSMRAKLLIEEKRQFDMALRDYDQAILLDPTSAAGYLNRGRVWRARHEYNHAIADYNEAIRLDPDFANAYNGRGNAWRHMKEYDKAIADYDEAIRLNPISAFIYVNRGLAWSDRHEYDKAIADYSQAIRLDPDLAEAYNGRGIAWQHKKEYDRAVADYDEAIRLDPSTATTM
jgi:tetratricopeptide (TPR) repeat protein